MIREGDGPEVLSTFRIGAADANIGDGGVSETIGVNSSPLASGTTLTVGSVASRDAPPSLVRRGRVMIIAYPVPKGAVFPSSVANRDDGEYKRASPVRSIMTRFPHSTIFLLFGSSPASSTQI